MTYRMRWTIGMTVFGVAVAVAVYLVTQSIGWAIVGVLASGMVANAVLAPRNARNRSRTGQSQSQKGPKDRGRLGPTS